MRIKSKCGAKTRKGTSCQAKGLLNGRCRNHGGMSTGPRTPEGRVGSLAALRRGNETWRLRTAKGVTPTLPELS